MKINKNSLLDWNKRAHELSNFIKISKAISSKRKLILESNLLKSNRFNKQENHTANLTIERNTLSLDPNEDQIIIKTDHSIKNLKSIKDWRLSYSKSFEIYDPRTSKQTEMFNLNHL